MISSGSFWRLWRNRKKTEFKRLLRLFSGRRWVVSMEYRYEKLAEYGGFADKRDLLVNE